MRPIRALWFALSSFLLLLIAGCGTTKLNNGVNGSCAEGALVKGLGRNQLLVGAQMEDAVAQKAAFDVRYLYLAGGIFDGATACTSCESSCTSSGTPCSGGGCNWWGCWQDTSKPPGEYVRQLLSKTVTNKQIPWITFYEILQASGAAEGDPEVAAVNDPAFMTRYFADFRFLTGLLGSNTAFLHIEPDFWGYAQQKNGDPHALPAAVASANPTDCAGQENSVAGLGKCLVAMARKYAPNTRVGLHASAWATGPDCTQNTDATLDVAAEAKKTGTFLVACGGADADFVGIETSDRDAAYYKSLGKDVWWDVGNKKLPHFHQAFTWAKALAETLGRPNIWWQNPVGNLALPNKDTQWQDNRVDYFYAHTQELADAHTAGIAFGAGAGGMTTPSTDNGNLVSRVKAYVAAGGQGLCH